MEYDGYKDFNTESQCIDLIGRTGTGLTKGIRSCQLQLDDVRPCLGNIKIWIVYRRLAYQSEDPKSSYDDVGDAFRKDQEDWPTTTYPGELSQ